MKYKKTACEEITQAVIVSELLIHTETLLKFVNTSACVNKLLLTCVERMALGADFDLDILLSGLGLDNVAASTGNSGLLVIRMDTLSHS